MPGVDIGGLAVVDPSSNVGSLREDRSILGALGGRDPNFPFPVPCVCLSLVPTIHPQGGFLCMAESRMHRPFAVIPRGGGVNSLTDQLLTMDRRNLPVALLPPVLTRDKALGPSPARQQTHPIPDNVLALRLNRPLRSRPQARHMMLDQQPLTDPRLGSGTTLDPLAGPDVASGMDGWTYRRRAAAFCQYIVK